MTQKIPAFKQFKSPLLGEEYIDVAEIDTVEMPSMPQERLFLPQLLSLDTQPVASMATPQQQARKRGDGVALAILASLLAGLVVVLIIIVLLLIWPKINW